MPRTTRLGASVARWAWCRDHVVPLSAAVLAVVFALVFCWSPTHSEWAVVFVRAACRMQAGESIYVIEPMAYAYPPAMAMWTAPLSWLPLWAGILCWYLINAAATTVVFVCAWRLAGGPGLLRLAPRWLAILGIGMLLGGRFFVAPLEHQQFDMVIAALLFAGCCRVGRGRDLSGAALLGAAAAMKCTPLLFAPYLVWRGKWRAAALVAAVALAMNLLPDLLWPQPSGRLYLTDWLHSFVSVAASGAPGAWFADWLQNQSLSAFFSRMVMMGLPLQLPDMTQLQTVATRALWLRVAVYGTGLLLLGVTAWRMGRPGRAAATIAAPAPRAMPLCEPRIGVEAAAVVCLMLLLSPMSSKAHYVVMILPAFWIARMIVETRNQWLYWLAAPLLICGPLSTKGLVGTTLGNLTLAWGLPTCYVLLSLFAVWHALGVTARRRSTEELAIQQAESAELSKAA